MVIVTYKKYFGVAPLYLQNEKKKFCHMIHKVSRKLYCHLSDMLKNVECNGNKLVKCDMAITFI